MASASDFEVVSEPKASDFEEVTPKAGDFEVVSEPSTIPELKLPDGVSDAFVSKLPASERAAINFAPEPLGKTLNRTGRVVSGALADAGTMTMGDLKKGEFPNIAAALADEKLPVTELMEAKSTPGAVSFPYKVTSGLVESTPKLAAVVGAEALGVPAPVAAGYVFGQTDTGFSSKDAAVAAALPFVGKYSGNIVGAIAKKFGVSSIDALNIWKGVGATGGAAAYAATIDESQIANLPPEQRNQARIDMIAGLIGQSALGPMGMEKEHSPFELVEKPSGNLDEQAVRDLSIRDKPAEVTSPVKPEEFELVQSIADKGAPATAKAVEQVLTHDFEEVKPAEAQPENSPLANPAESGNSPVADAKPSGFAPPPEPKTFNSLEDLLAHREKYKQAEVDFYKSLGLDENDALKMWRAGDARSKVDTGSIEAKLTPENRARLDLFSTGEGSRMYQWDKMFDPSRVAEQADKSELASNVINAIDKEGLNPGMDDKFIFMAASLRKLKEQGGTWSDIARALDKYTTDTSGSQGDKEFAFKKMGGEIRKFAESQGVALASGDLGVKLGVGADVRKIETGSGAAGEAAMRTESGFENSPLANPAESGNSPVAAETFTGLDEGKASVMPAEPGEGVGSQAEPIPGPPQTSKHTQPDRPWDIIDEIEGNIGKIRGHANAPEGTEGYYTAKYDEVRKLNSVRKILSNSGGVSPDDVVDSLRRSGVVKDDFTVDDLWDELSQAAQARKGFRKTQKPLDELESQVKDFQRLAVDNKRRGDEKKNAQSVQVNDLLEGDEFTLDGAKFKVKELVFDPDSDELTHVMVEDGRRFGVQYLGPDQIIHVDKGSLAQKEVSTDFVPKDELFSPEETPFNLASETAKPEESKTTFGGETLAQQEMFSIHKIVESKDPFKSADAAEKLYGGPKEAADKIRKQLAVVDADPQTKKAFAKEQRGRLKEVVALLDERAAKGISEGPGAASPTDFPNGSELKQLTDSLSKGVKSDSPLPKQISVIERASDAMADAKDTFKTSLARLKAVGDAVYQKFTQRPQWTDEKAAVGKWTYANQKADREAMQFRKEIEKAIPDKARREAMTNWIQANGDEALLKSRADASKGSIKRGYESAMKLTEYEKTVAKNVSQYLDAQLQRGIDADILSNGIENYVNQVWKRENPITRAIRSDFQSSKLQPNFRFAKERIFSSYFEGEQAGYAPSNKDLGALIAFYDQAFNKTLSARAFLRDLHEGNASDGRPLVEVAGSGDTIEGNKGSTILIKPRTQKQEVWDYREIDHPAMRGWKWVGSDTKGSPIMMQGQLLVHPEAYVKLRNRLQSSGWRTNPIGKAILDTQSVVKQTMLSISGFHQAQETIHALGHRVNPTNLDKIDLDDPTQKALVTHGLQVADYHAAEMFGEGLSSGALTNKIPWVGNKILKPYTEWLFQEYIPRLKITMAREALERNTATYGTKLNRDQILELTAQQANAAFGELNYKFMGRNPTLQDTFRAFLLAPDFLEARAQFVGQALRPHGREQLVALGILAATQFISARIWNKMLDDDYHWGKPFSYVYNGREYKLRTVPGDIIHLASDRQSFAYNRLSPLLGRSLMEWFSGRDDRGVKRDTVEQVKDAAKMAVPISMKLRDDTKLWEAFLNSFGLQEKKFSAVTEISEQARKFKSANSKPTPYEEVYDAEKDAYRPLRVALDNKNLAAAQKAYDDLKKTVPPNTIAQSIHRYYTKPFAGSIQNEANFTHQLDAHGKETYQKAGQERLQNLKFFGTVRK